MDVRCWRQQHNFLSRLMQQNYLPQIILPEKNTILDPANAQTIGFLFEN